MAQNFPVCTRRFRLYFLRECTYSNNMNNATNEVDFLALLLAPASAEDEARWAAELATHATSVETPVAQALSADDVRELDINAKINARLVAAAPSVKVEDAACRCGKCNGTGYLSQYAYHAGGVCFACDGSGRR